MTPVCHLGVYGLGKLGLPLAASFAAAGVRTFGIDVNRDLVARLKRGEITSSEPGLSELIHKAGDTLSVHDGPDGLNLNASLIQVPTPSSPDDPSFSARCVLDALNSVCAELARRPSPAVEHLVIIASTVMPGTIAAKVRPVLDEAARQTGCVLRLAYVPDLVAIGDVIKGFHKPPCLMIGTDDATTAHQVEDLYARIMAPDVPRSRLTIAETEISKVAWNFYFCLKISFANTLARLASHASDVNVDRLTQTLAIDPRIGKGFLQAGMPFGGPCFPRDVDAMEALLAMHGLDGAMARSVRKSNADHGDFIVQCVLAEGAQSAGIAGLAFKQGTDVTDQSPAFAVMQALMAAGVKVHAYDPSERARDALAEALWAKAVTCWDSLDGLAQHVDVVVAAVNDPRLLPLGDIARSGKSVIDPWGFLPSDVPSLRRPGRDG